MKEELFWLAFSLSGASSADLLKLHGSKAGFSSAWNLTNLTLWDLLRQAGISEEKAQKIISQRPKVSLAKFFERLSRRGVKLLIYTSADYPELLRHIHDAPALLYVLGDEKVLSKNMVAVVGSRRCTDYGVRVCRKMASELARQGVVIASGLAPGIDFVAHTAAIESGGHTVAVAPYGFDMAPSTQQGLMHRIARQGAVVSEYAPFISARDYTFIERNRIIAGLSLGTLVVEAASRSGARNTARHARQNNREAFAVPGPIDSETSIGTNEMIKSLEACQAVSAQDILNELKIVTKNTDALPLDLSEQEKHLYKLLRQSQLTPDEIIKSSGLTPDQILSAISLLEIKGIIRKNINGRFHLNNYV